ncbi:hypothetical protein [Nitrospira sp. BLG_2]|uniref:hypothetical protein n=1 Tax=Nitrospira sp. BLG_2 TaxID=3397507 RepID=UPI003B9A3CAB
MPIVDAYAERKYQQVMEETWGHLRAKPNSSYNGSFTFAHDLTGMDCLLNFDFPDELDDSPWLHQDIQDYMSYTIEKHGNKRGTIFRFEGRYEVDSKGCRRFVGKCKQKSLNKLILLAGNKW